MLAAPLFDRLIRHWSREDPARPAFATEKDVLTYGQLERRVEETAALLAESGVARGDRVVLQLPPSAEYVVAFLATTTLGAIAVPVATSIGADRLAYVIELTEPRVCVQTGGQLRSSDAPPAAPKTSTPIDDDALVLFSSGSTGRPKGVVLKQRHLLAIAENLSTVYRLDRAHRDLIIAPMAHSDGLQRVLSTLFAGGTVVSPTHALPTNAILEFLRKHEITGFFMPPPLLRLLMKSPPAAFKQGTRTLRSIEFGSAPITAEEFRHLAREIPDAGIYFHYGLTECSRAVILDVRAHPDKLGTVGRGAPGVSIRVCDESGRDVKPGEAGQILLRGKQLTEGYFKLDALNREKLVSGWLLTGDFGKLDEQGFLELHGRRDDMITSAGFHFFPAEVETELGRVPGVVDYLIAGVPDPHGILEQIPWAFVVPHDAAAWAPGAFLAFARDRLPSHMVPRAAIAVPEIPLAASGKPDRRKAVELYGRKSK